MTAETPEVFEFLLNCQICLEPFDQKVRIPRVLPCLHTFCSPCIAKLDRGGNLACPNDRKEFKVSGPFPVDFTRAAVVEHKDVLLKKGEASLPLVEACQKHQHKKLKFFCSTCKNALCSECAVIEHKSKVGHDIVKLGDVLEQVKGEVKKDLSGLVQYVEELGSLVPGRSQSRESKTAEQRAERTQAVTSQNAGVLTTPTVTSSTILTPEIQLESGRCRGGCTLEEDGRTLTNKPRPPSSGTGQSGPRPFAFLGTCGSVDLAQPALHYWTLRFCVLGCSSGDRCEFGLASPQILDACGERQKISDHGVNSATLIVVGDGDKVILEGKNWTKDVDTPQPRQRRDVTYTCLWEGKMVRQGRYGAYDLDMTLGFLYDNRQPQSPRVLVVETKSCRLLGVRRLSPSPDLRPVLRVWPARYDWGFYDASLQVKTGPAVLRDTTAWQLQNLLERIDR